MTIRDEEHYRVTLAHVIKFRVELARVEATPPPNADPQRHQAGLDAMRAQLDAIERDLREYEARSR